MKTKVMEERTETQAETLTVPIFGYELLRDHLIPDLLGKDSADITYWAGKQMARKFPLLSFEEIRSFFFEANWGTLQLIEQTRKGMKLELSGPIIDRRMQMAPHPCFRLEAGFLAEQIQAQKQVISEAFEETNKKQRIVTITVQWDTKDAAD